MHNRTHAYQMKSILRLRKSKLRWFSVKYERKKKRNQIRIRAKEIILLLETNKIA